MHLYMADRAHAPMMTNISDQGTPRQGSGSTMPHDGEDDARRDRAEKHPDRAMGTTSPKEESDREEAGGRPTPPTMAQAICQRPCARETTYPDGHA